MTKKEIEFKCELAYQEKFLELTGKKVGDRVKCSFTYHHGDSKRSYMSSIEGYGTIVCDEKGYAVLSDEEYTTSKEVRNKPWNVSDFSCHWEYGRAKCRTKLNFILLED